MNVEDLANFGIRNDFISRFKADGISEFFPPQEEAVKHKVLDGQSLVLSVPTAAGKTLVATLAILKKLSARSKAVYIVPLVALAYEKFEYYKKFLGDKWKVAISVGELDSSDPWLADYDLIICTSEKLDSLIRHGARWAGSIGLVIADEIHMINDSGRGPTLEILLTKLREITNNPQFVVLSATINNADELSEWLDADLVVSDFRPVELYEGVSCESKIQFFGRDGYDLEMEEDELAITKNTLDLKKQVLFFVSTRKNAESLAKKLAQIVKPKLKRGADADLERASEEALNVLESPTRQCKQLADCIRNGVAFHHAGLLSKQKRLIEENFKSGLIKVIAATPTLALGVNLPAFRVVVRDAKRYYVGLGMAYIPVLEYKQFVGRAGRPQYDSFGESILVAKSKGDARELTDRYILGEPEDIKSKLAAEPVLRMHTLALIADGFAKSEKDLFKFFSKTFYAYQYGDISIIEGKLLEILEKLEKWKFISRRGDIKPTRLGKRVVELYLDPFTANHFVKCLKRMARNRSKRQRSKPIATLTLLQGISNSLEMRPLLSVSAKDFTELNEIIAQNEGKFLQPTPEQWDLEFDDFLRSVKTAKLFESWINEKTEDQILSEFRVAPGELRSKLHIADWLIYSVQEIALLLGYKDSLKPVRKLRVRMKYGVREDLLPLVRLKGIGRVRARKLFNSNLKSLSDLRKIPLSSLSRIIGPSIAAIIKEQLGEKTKKPKKTKQVTLDIDITRS